MPPSIQQRQQQRRPSEDDEAYGAHGDDLYDPYASSSQMSALASPTKGKDKGNKDEMYRLRIQGARSVTVYKTRSRRGENEKMVILVGEYHTDPGNAQEIVETLLRENPGCPIDVVVEKSFYDEPPTNSMLDDILDIPDISNISNIGYFKTREKSLCSSIHTTTKDHRDKFYKQCVEPYHGRVKVWAIDFRDHPPLQTLVEYCALVLERIARKNKEYEQLSGTYQRFIQHVRRVVESILDVKTYHKDKDRKAYIEQIREIFQQAMNGLPNTIKNHPTPTSLTPQQRKGPRTDPLSYFKELQDRVASASGNIPDIPKKNNDKKKKKVKDFMYLMDSFLYLDSIVRRKIRRILHDFLSDMDNNFHDILILSGLLELYALLRIVRLLREPSSSILLVLAGNQHVSMLRRFFKIKDLYRYETDKEEDKGVQGIQGHTEVKAGYKWDEKDERDEGDEGYEGDEEKEQSSPPKKPLLPVSSFYSLEKIRHKANPVRTQVKCKDIIISLPRCACPLSTERMLEYQKYQKRGKDSEESKGGEKEEIKVNVLMVKKKKKNP